MAGTIINVSMYSLNPLPMELRSTFELPVWPYSQADGSMPAELAAYFKQYSIFYYRDEITKGNELRPGLVTPGINFETPIDCYRHSCYIDYGNRTFKIVPWWPQCSREFVMAEVQRTGDRMAWTGFNEPRILKGFNSRFIKSSAVNKPTPTKSLKSVEDFR